MKVNIKAAAAPAQQYADQLSQNAQFNSIFGGLVSGGLGYLQGKQNAYRYGQLQGSLADQIKTLDQRNLDKTLPPELRMAYGDEAMRLQSLLNTLTPSNIDETQKAYLGLYSKISDPRELANQLKLAHITGQYRVEAAKQGGNALRFLFGGVGDLGDIEGSLPFSQNATPSSISTPQGAQDPIDRGLNLAKQQITRLQGG